MDLWQQLLSGAQLIGWALLHFVWQGVLLGAMYALLRQLLPRGAARYWLGMATLFGFAMCLPITLWRLLDVASLGQVVETAAVLVTGASPAAVNPAHWLSSATLNALLPWFVLAWLGGIFLLSFRAWRQWRRLKVLVRAAELVPQWKARIGVMAQRLGLERPIDVLCSKLVAAPVVIGWIKPVILLPVAVVCNFSTSQIELILAHELAHLRRWDPLANLFQLILETLLFYHPVVHWVSREVRNEREICCDAVALSVTGGSRHEFVGVLAELGELRERQTSMLLAANGGALLDRVQVVIVPERAATARARMPIAFMALFVAAATVMVSLHMQRNHEVIEKGLSQAAVRIETAMASQLLRLPLPAAGAAWRPAVANLEPALGGATTRIAPISEDRPVTVVDPGASARAHLLQHLAPLPVSRPVPTARDPLPAIFADLQLAPLSPPAVADAPTAVHIREPVYPPAAWADGIEGRVVIEFGLSADGRVLHPHVLDATPARIFNQAALDAVSGWRFALPSDAAPAATYRQVVAFSRSGSHAQRTRGRAQGNYGESGRGACRAVTGTHICRDADPLGFGVVSGRALRSQP